ncbi:MAG: ribose ABC transporter permease [Burkholderiales bacterium RIFCSPLOWO2_12_67_14]|nr:MAG: ribose ABC transporter permease [Burkholderiales bacterium RIFCSPLOWO2_02_FULL_67_64]OGB39954.1 MAG: ribose ABC transporter permease [Burkholderiales bacterium RIFCSPHIGHO2_12_FULL_67_38]OGB40158.1 MAG: ribose ABC transporter permease [Burkholderiales bacterium RIFCSPLOWO2_12_67_14]OGB76887.1 MAG: ribose ABC transporter permease [Burkholderiales bacterium RIFCSPLOWO2_12_FULL_67_210]
MTQTTASSWLTRLSGGQAKQMLLAFASLIALLLVFTLLNPDAFMTKDNIIGILQSTTVIGVLAIASTFIIITSGIDLSVGVLMTFCAVMAGVFMVNLGLPMPLGIVGALLMGALSGTTAGLAITKLKVPPFIATLGMMMLLKGASLIITNTRPIYFSDVEGFDQIALGSLIGDLIPSLSIPNGVLILFLVAAVCALVLNKTALGRYTFALGSNEEAVRLSGVNVDRWKVIIYAFSGGICGIAGLLIASRLNSAQPALGQGYELDAIAAVVIGGTSLSGGVGTILGTLIGAFIMSVLINGLRIMSVAQEWQMVLTGLIIILAVYTDNLRRRKT